MRSLMGIAARSMAAPPSSEELASLLFHASPWSFYVLNRSQSADKIDSPAVDKGGAKSEGEESRAGVISLSPRARSARA